MNASKYNCLLFFTHSPPPSTAIYPPPKKKKKKKKKKEKKINMELTSKMKTGMFFRFAHSLSSYLYSDISQIPTIGYSPTLYSQILANTARQTIRHQLISDSCVEYSLTTFLIRLAYRLHSHVDNYILHKTRCTVPLDTQSIVTSPSQHSIIFEAATEYVGKHCLSFP